MYIICEPENLASFVIRHKCSQAPTEIDVEAWRLNTLMASLKSMRCATICP